MSEACGVVRPREFEIDALRSQVRKVEEQIFQLIQIPLEMDREVIASVPLIANSVLLLTGPPGSAKNTMTSLIGRAYFSDGSTDPDMAMVTCHPDLTSHEVLHFLDLPELMQGRQMVHPHPLVVRRLKYINEIQRASPALQNALLPLLSEGEVRYRLEEPLRSPSYVCVMDRNPADYASRELAPAFLDRIDYGVVMPTPHLCESLAITAQKQRGDDTFWPRLDRRASVHLGIDALEKIWREVSGVYIRARAELYANMLIDYFRLCVKEERSTLNPSFDLDCSNCGFRGEICSHLEAVPGHRPLESLLRLAQAWSWRRGRSEVDYDCIPSLLPYVLGHRVQLRRDLHRSVPHSMGWIEDVGVGQMVRSKEKVWRGAIAAVLDGDPGPLEAYRENDLVVRYLAMRFKDPAVDALRKRHRREQNDDLVEDVAAGAPA